MTALLLDASVWLAAIDERDRLHRPSRDLISQGEHELAALDLTLLEVSNMAITRWKAPAEAERLVDLVSVACADRIVRCDAALVAAAAILAATEMLSVYDAAYVAAADDRGWRLVSGDVRDLVGPGHAVDPGAIIGDPE